MRMPFCVWPRLLLSSKLALEGELLHQIYLFGIIVAVQAARDYTTAAALVLVVVTACEASTRSLLVSPLFRERG